MSDFSPAQPQRLFHPPALSLPRQTLRPGTHRSAGKAAVSEDSRRKRSENAAWEKACLGTPGLGG